MTFQKFLQTYVLSIFSLVERKGGRQPCGKYRPWARPSKARRGENQKKNELTGSGTSCRVD